MRRIWLVALVLAVAATACSDDDAGNDTTPPTDAPSTTVPGDCAVPGLDAQVLEIGGFISDYLMPDYRTVRHDSDFTSCLSWHDWSTDDCSGPIGSTGPAFDFTHPCHRHDFGYRNYKRVEAALSQDLWNEESKLVVDNQFLEDNREHCSTRTFYEKSICLAWAQTYYWAVRAFGT